jgi:RNA polymerase sigma factor (sigma-70 family)
MKNPRIEEKALVQQILAGNQRAFKEFILQYQNLVSHLVFRMIPNDSDREDICQDIFLKVYQHLANFQFESKLSTWIAKITYNTCLNFLEKKRVSLFDDLTPEELTLDDLSGSSALPDSFTEKQDISRRLQMEIEKLPVHYRTILTLYHLDEMSYREICQITEMPEGTVKNYLFRARKMLKDRLKMQYKPEEL